MRNEIEIKMVPRTIFDVFTKNLGRGDYYSKPFSKFFEYARWISILTYLVSPKNVEHHYDIGGEKGEKLYDIFR